MILRTAFPRPEFFQSRWRKDGRRDLAIWFRFFRVWSNIVSFGNSETNLIRLCHFVFPWGARVLDSTDNPALCDPSISQVETPTSIPHNATPRTPDGVELRTPICRVLQENLHTGLGESVTQRLSGSGLISPLPTFLVCEEIGGRCYYPTIGKSDALLNHPV